MLTKQFFLDISLKEEEDEDLDAGNVEDGPKSLVEKMKSYFQTQIGQGRFLARDHVAFKNLKTYKDKTVIESSHVSNTTDGDSITEDHHKESDLSYRREEH